MRALLLTLLCASCASEAPWARTPEPRDEPRDGALEVRTSHDFETGVVVHRWVTRLVEGRIVKEGKEQHFWPDGSPRAERFHAGGLATGRWRTWHANGSLRSDYTYADDVREMLFYFEDGTPEARGAAIHGVRTGVWTWWHPDGTVKQEGPYVEGRKHGRFTIRHPGGALKSRGLYRADGRVGEWKHWPASPATRESDWSPPGG